MLLADNYATTPLEVVETYLTAMEVECIKRSFREVKVEIEEWEFQTRIGISVEEAKKIMEKLTNQSP